MYYAPQICIFSGSCEHNTKHLGCMKRMQYLN